MDSARKLLGRRALLVWTFVAIIVVALLCPDTRTAVALAGCIVAMAVLFGEEEKGSGREGYRNPTDGPPLYAGAAPPQPVAVAPVSHPRPRAVAYPGAIAVDEYETEPEYGHRDRLEGDDADEAYGNPYSGNRVWRPAAAGADYDDEANDAEMDADELNAYQGRSRNDPDRVAAGTMNRRKMMDPYLREEVEEAEDRQWWGRHEL
jgi:hypothetical protein